MHLLRSLLSVPHPEAALILVCLPIVVGGCSDSTPVTPTPTTAAFRPADSERVDPDSLTVERRVIEVVGHEYDNCSLESDARGKVFFEREVTHTITGGDGRAIEPSGKVVVKGLVEVGLGAVISSYFESEVGETTKIGQDIPIITPAGKRQRHAVEIFRVIKSGDVIATVGEEEIRVPFSFADEVNSSYRGGTDLPCEQRTPLATTVMPSPDHTPTNTPTLLPPGDTPTIVSFTSTPIPTPTATVTLVPTPDAYSDLCVVYVDPNTFANCYVDACTHPDAYSDLCANTNTYADLCAHSHQCTDPCTARRFVDPNTSANRYGNACSHPDAYTDLCANTNT